MNIYTKTITITISQEKYPMLFDICQDKLLMVYNKIFSYGYSKYFPEVDDKESDIKSYISNKYENMETILNDKTKLLTNDISVLKSTLDTLDFSNKIDNFEELLQELFGINNNSAKKGKLGEDIIYKIIESKFKDSTLIKTRNIPHSGDAILTIPNENKGNNILIEIKNYSKAVDKNEINKMKYDMINTKTHYGLMISLKTGFVSRKNMCIEKYIHKNNTYTILFIPNISANINKLESSVLLLEKIIGLDKYTQCSPKITNNIKEKIKELDEVYDSIKTLRDNFNKIEDNIKEQFNTFYLYLKKHEDIMRNKIDNIFEELDNDISNYKYMDITNYNNKIIDDINKKRVGGKYILKEIIKIIDKYGYKIYKILDPDNYSTLYWHIVPNNSKIHIGTIIKNKKYIEININIITSTEIIFNNGINYTKKDIHKKLYNLENTMKYILKEVS